MRTPRKFTFMLVYPMGIQIYDQVSILRSWSKVKLHRAVLLGFGLKVLKIALNIVKVGVHFYLSNRHPNLDQISIPRNWSEVKLCRAFSLELGLKGVQIAQNIAKVGMHACLSNGHPNLWSIQFWEFRQKWTPCVVSLRFGLNEGKKAMDITKFGMHSYLPNGHLNLRSNFNSKKLVRSETSSCIFARVGLKRSPNSSEHCKSWHACLYIKRASKSMIKFQYREFGQKWNSIMRFR